MERVNWDQYWLKILTQVSARSTCDRGMCGAVLVDEDQQVISTGYAGAPRGLPHCDDVGHLIHRVIYKDGSEHEHCVRTAHAERNAIVQAARRGISVKGATLYCTMEPCLNCTVDIINAGIKRIVVTKTYHGAELSRQWLADSGIPLEIM